MASSIYHSGVAVTLDCVALDGYGVPHDVKFYAGTRHSFFNDLRRAHDPEAAADSWQRTLAFFDRYLRGAA